MFEWEHLHTFYFDGSDCPNGVTISPYIFSNSTLLKDLTIRSSKQGYHQLIKSLNIKNLKNLKILDLSNNNITYVSDAKDFPRHLEKLNLSENPLQFSKALQKLDVLCIFVKDGRKCFNTNSVKKELCYSANNSNYNSSDCQDDFFVENPSIIWTILITMVTLIVLLFAGILYYYFHFRSSSILWNNVGVKYFKRQQQHHDEDLKKDFKYDIFIIGHDKNFCECKNIDSADGHDEKEELILHDLLSNLSHGSLGKTYNVASKTKDYLPGILEHTNLHHFTENSKKIIVLLSNSFIKSNYHINEFREMAAMHNER